MLSSIPYIFVKHLVSVIGNLCNKTRSFQATSTLYTLTEVTKVIFNTKNVSTQSSAGMVAGLTIPCNWAYTSGSLHYSLGLNPKEREVCYSGVCALSLSLKLSSWEACCSSIWLDSLWFIVAYVRASLHSLSAATSSSSDSQTATSPLSQQQNSLSYKPNNFSTGQVWNCAFFFFSMHVTIPYGKWWNCMSLMKMIQQFFFSLK